MSVTVVVRRRATLALALFVGSIVGPRPALGQDGAIDGFEAPAATAPVDSDAASRLSVKTELALMGVGVDLVLFGRLIPVPARPIPVAGFDPSGIPLGIDRSAVGRFDGRAGSYSDRTLDAAMAFPLLVAWVSGGARRWQRTGESGVILAETLLINGALTQIGKRSFARARPHAYLEDATVGRPDQDGPGSGAFHSMPSGHTSAAWAATAMGITEHLLTRPEAPTWERLGVSFAGGALAGATAALRVDAGAHFPSDVVVGAGLGTLVGVAVPWVHRGDATAPPLRARIEALAGTALGAFIGVSLAGQR